MLALFGAAVGDSMVKSLLIDLHMDNNIEHAGALFVNVPFN